jgi:hypothetical protein
MIMRRAAMSAGQTGRNGHASPARRRRALFNGIAPPRRISHALSELGGCQRWGIWTRTYATFLPKVQITQLLRGPRSWPKVWTPASHVTRLGRR